MNRQPTDAEIRAAQFLTETMRDAGVKQIDLANKLGVSDASINKWVKGTNAIPHARAAEIAAYLGIADVTLIAPSYNGEAPVVRTTGSEARTLRLIEAAQRYAPDLSDEYLDVAINLMRNLVAAGRSASAKKDET